MGWMVLIKLILPFVMKKNKVSFSEAEMLFKLGQEIGNLFARSKRTCVDKKFECTYREGACVVLSEKGSDWTLEDIKTCPYRKRIGDSDEN